MNLILLESSEVSEAGVVRVTGVRAAHLLDVLKIEPGQQVRVGVLDGAAGVATVMSVGDASVELACQFGSTPPRPRVDLLLAVPRPKVMRRLWAQIAALGVGQIILTNAARVERNYFDAHALSPGIYEPLLIEGLQQARDTRLPVVSIHRQFRILVEDHLQRLFPQGRRLVAHPGREISIPAALQGHRRDRVLLAVGPEGGWNDFELSLLEAHGFGAVGLGARSLRTDTACVGLLAIVHATIDYIPS